MVAVVVGFAGCQFVRNDNLNQAALAGAAEQVNGLLRTGANVNGKGMHAMTPIMSAAKGGHLEVVKELIARGADVNCHNDSGSVLMWAIGSGNEELVRFLLNRGADAHWTNHLGQTALNFAREQRKTNVVQMLEVRLK